MSNPLKIAALRWAYASVRGIRIQIPWDTNEPQYGKYHYAFSKGTRQQIIAYTEGNCSSHDKAEIEAWMKGQNASEIHVGIDCSGFVYRTLDEAAQMSGAPSLLQTMGTACEYTWLDSLTPRGQEIHRAVDVRAGDTMRFHDGKHSGVVIETVVDGSGVLREIWYAHSSFTRGPHIGWVEVNDPQAPINDDAQDWHDQMWDYLTNNNLRDLYFTSVHHSDGIYRGQRPQVAKVGGVHIAVGDREIAFTVPPFVLGGRTLCQMRPLAEAMGADIAWDQDSQMVTMVKGPKTAQCQVGSEVGIVNGAGYFLDEPPMMIDDTVVVPVRFLAEALGYQVGWNQGQRLVTLTQ